MSSKWCLSPRNSPRALPHVPQPTQPAPCPQQCRGGQQDTRTQGSAGSSGADPCSSVPPHTAPEDATPLGTQPSWTSGNSSTPKWGAQSVLGFRLAPAERGCLAPNPMGFAGQGGLSCCPRSSAPQRAWRGQSSPPMVAHKMLPVDPPCCGRTETCCIPVRPPWGRDRGPGIKPAVAAMLSAGGTEGLAQSLTLCRAEDTLQGQGWQMSLRGSRVAIPPLPCPCICSQCKTSPRQRHKYLEVPKRQAEGSRAGPGAAAELAQS